VSLPLRPYQIDCHDAVLREWGIAPWWDGERATSDSTVANLATAAGKTIIAAHLAKSLVDHVPGARVLFIADREELIQQPVEKFHAACRIQAAVHRGSDVASSMADVVVASVQTLTRRLPPGKPFTHIICDEAHRSTEQRAAIHAKYPGAKLLGITATAFRKNMADLSKWWKTIAFELGTFDLISEGYLVPILVQTLALEVDLTHVRQQSGDYDQGQVESVLVPHYRAVARAIKEHAPSRQILAFLPLIRSSIEFVSVLKQEGITAMHCDGQSDDRRGIIHQFEEREFQVLSNSQVFSTGVDFIHCDALLNLAPTRSRVEYRQRAGRIMRLLPGTIDPGGIVLPTAAERRAAIAASEKPSALILDLLWQTSTIGLAGPASLFATSEAEEEEIAKRVRKKRSPEELEEVSREVKRAKEEELAEALRKADERQMKETNRKANLRDARELMLELHAQQLLEFEAVNRAEASPLKNRWMIEKIERLGIDAASLSGTGQAQKLIDAVEGRQRAGLAPVEAFAQLKAAGFERPDQVSLNDAIRALGENFPTTFGKKHHGKPLKDVPKSYWTWLMFDDGDAAVKSRENCQRLHPACWRFLTKRVFPPASQQKVLT
jgi:superfamily II DNA or RNA helicase